MSKHLFIIGTGTNIGKTYITGLIVKKLFENNVNVGYFKPVMSGNKEDMKGMLIPGDAQYVKNISNISQDISEMCPYIYKNEVSPHLAAKFEGNPVQIDTLYNKFNLLNSKYEFLTIEGAGGIICPIRFDNEKIWLSDIIKKYDIGCLLVADAGLGTINSVALTSFYMKENGIKLKGIILNRFDENNAMHKDNKNMCEYVANTKVIACVKNNDDNININLELLKSMYN